MTRRRLIAFDLDDTLYNEIDFVLSGYRCVADLIRERCGVDVFSFMKDAFVPDRDVFSLTIEHFRLTLDKQILIDTYRSHCPDIRLSDETVAALRHLSEICRLALITDGRSATQRAKCRALRLERFIDPSDWIISDETGSAKPALAGYLYFELKYPGYTYTYVGNNLLKDFIAPNRLGWQAVCLLDNGRNIRPQDFTLPQANLPQRSITNLQQLSRLI